MHLVGFIIRIITNLREADFGIRPMCQKFWQRMTTELVSDVAY